MNVGDRIEDLRKKQGMTQEQLAQKIGATRQAVSKWESGKSYPDIDYVVRMGECFSVSADYLLLGKEAAAGNPENASLEKDDKWKQICFGMMAIVGVCLTLLLPLFVELYHQYRVGSYQSYHKDMLRYYFEWPMLGIVVFSIGLAIFGIGGMIHFIYTSRKVVNENGRRVFPE